MRDYCVAKIATQRAARPDPSRRKERLLRVTIKLTATGSVPCNMFHSDAVDCIGKNSCPHAHPVVPMFRLAAASARPAARPPAIPTSWRRSTSRLQLRPCHLALVRSCRRELRFPPRTRAKAGFSPGVCWLDVTESSPCWEKVGWARCTAPTTSRSASP